MRRLVIEETGQSSAETSPERKTKFEKRAAFENMTNCKDVVVYKGP